jgi:hypothetical protein
MSGNIAGRQRKWPWAFLSFLFAMTFAFAVSQVGGVWSIVRIGSAVGLGISVLVLVIRVISSRRLRRAEENVAGAEGDEVAETEPDAEEGPRTYEEVFGLQPHLDTDGLPPAPEDEEAWAGNEVEETGIDAEETGIDVEETGVDAEAFEASEAEASEVEGSEAEVETLEADGGLQDDLQRMREEFRARAEQAALRVKQREAEPQDAEPQEDDLKEAELQEAASVADQER